MPLARGQAWGALATRADAHWLRPPHASPPFPSNAVLRGGTFPRIAVSQDVRRRTTCRNAGHTLTQNDTQPEIHHYDPGRSSQASGSSHVDKGTLIDPIFAALRASFEAGLGPPLADNSSDARLRRCTRDWVHKSRQSILNRQVPLSVRNSFHDSELREANSHDVLAHRIRAMVVHRLHSGQATSRPSVALDAAARSVLQRAGHSPRQLEAWSLLLTQDPTDILILCALFDRSNPAQRIVPTIVLLAFVRRRYLNQATMVLLVRYLATYTERSTSEFEHGRACRSVKSTTTNHIRLLDALSVLFEAYCNILRHARFVWPEALPFLATNFVRCTSHMIQGYNHVVPRPFPLLAPLLTFMHNEVLAQVGMPCAVSPYKNGLNQHAAQTAILHQMSCPAGSLDLTMSGYRAALKVQLAQPKTPEEHLWASLKSPSWPPWKRERTGMDDLIGPEYGVSRAGNVANKAKEAGFSLGSWEAAAMIHAGWDTDGSPTIQTRSSYLSSSDARHGEAQVWAARIRCTRTLQESWACFLASEDSQARPDDTMYTAMFERVQSERKRLYTVEHKRPDQISTEAPAGTTRESEPAVATLIQPNKVETDRPNPISPGDSRELSAPPTNVQYETYTKTPPPTMGDLTQHMRDSNTRPSPATIAMLVDNSASIEEATSHIFHARNGNVDMYRPLIGLSGRVDYVPTRVFVSFVRLLSVSRKYIDKSGQDHVMLDGLALDARHPCVHAFQLLLKCRHVPRPAFNALLQGLSNRRKGAGLISATSEYVAEMPPTSRDMLLEKVVAASLARRLASALRERDLPLDVDGYLLLCKVLANAADSSRRLKDDATSLDDLHSSIRPLLWSMIARESTNGGYLEQHFLTLVGAPSPSMIRKANAEYTHDRLTSSSRSVTAPDAATTQPSPLSTLPRLYAYPGPALLHAYVRALGASGDMHGILNLAQWIKEYWPEVQARLSQDRSGEAMFRKVIVAMRAFLQGSRPVVNSSRENEDVHWTEAAYRELRHESDEADEDIDQLYEAPPELVTGTIDVVESMREWGGWPGPEEVQLYRSNGERPVSID